MKGSELAPFFVCAFSAAFPLIHRRWRFSATNSAFAAFSAFARSFLILLNRAYFPPYGATFRWQLAQTVIRIGIMQSIKNILSADPFVR